MDVLKSKYYYNARLLLEILGLWPYQSTIKRWTSIFTYYLITSSLIAPMVFHLMFNEPKVSVWAENSIMILYTMFSQLKYTVTFISVTEFKVLLSQIKKDWRKIKDREELDILKNLSEQSRLISFFWTVYVFIAVLVFNGSSVVACCLEKIFPLKNGSYPQLYPVYSEFLFFEQSDYYLLTCIHILAVFTCVGTLYAATDVIYLCTVQHVAALFSIVCHKLENVFNSDDTEVNMDDLKEAVELFNECVRCCSSLENAFSICIFMEFVGCSTAMAGCSIIILSSKDFFVRVKMAVVLFGIILHVLYVNWVGQKIIDTSEEVFDSIYFSDWYLKPAKIQKLITIVMCRTFKPQELTAGKIIILSMYTFGQLIRGCSSIFAVFSWIAEAGY